MAISTPSNQKVVKKSKKKGRELESNQIADNLQRDFHMNQWLEENSQTYY